jgi:site-specific DNA-methyltransferase (adenine-specific)
VRDSTPTEGEEAAASWVSVDTLKPWADNPRNNSPEHVEQVANSIRRLGWGAPIVARENGEIIAGHTRFEAAKALGLDTVPVRFVDLDPVDAKLLALADNRLTEKGEWDTPALNDLLADLSADEHEVIGFSSADLDLLASEVAGRSGELSEPEARTAEEEWEGMPEFGQENAGPFRTIKVHFQDADDVEDFARLISQDISAGAKYIWHPKAERLDVADLRYVSDDED